MKIKKIIPISALIVLFSCTNYLDVVPDNVATLDYAFTRRLQARDYLFTCYSFLIGPASLTSYNFLAGDELVINPNVRFRTTAYQRPSEFARGGQNADGPLLNYYRRFYQGIRVCSTFLERVEAVPDLEEDEKTIWKAEAKFLKAYYHFLLLRMYGPIILRPTNLPINATPEQVAKPRDSFDDCVKYISGLFDEAIADLPDQVANPDEELGRVTRPIALAMKAKLLVTAASPLFNGNPSYASFNNKDGKALFSDYDLEKWKLAADAALAAIEGAEAAKHELYEYQSTGNEYTDPTKLRLTLRGRVPQPNWGSKEIIWADTRGTASYIQRISQARLARDIFDIIPQFLSPTLRIARQYYTENGVPIEEDKAWEGRDLFSTRASDPATRDTLWVKNGKHTAVLHFNREPRFYADLGFDRGIWFGQGRYLEQYKGTGDQSVYHVEARLGEYSGKVTIAYYSATGYFPKKLVYYKNTMSKSYAATRYAFPILRLADLYLLYAEALNEYSGPSDQVYDYLDKVRARAGLKSVLESWQDHAKDEKKPTRQEGLRDIIQKERLIELAMEGHRFWDLRRWKLAVDLMNLPIEGWNVEEKSREGFYKILPIYFSSFTNKDYLWPIQNDLLLKNLDLVQNPGW